MLADDAAHIAPGGAGLAAEARRVRHQFDGQRVGLQRLIAINVGHGDLGRRNQPKIVALALEKILLELGQLSGAVKAGRVHQERRQHFGITVFAGVRVEHEIDQRALQLRAHAPVERETGAGNLGGALEIEDAQFGAEVPVRFGLEIELRRIAHAAHFQIVVGILAHRHGIVRHVGNSGQQFLEFGIRGLRLFLERGDFDLHRAHLFLQGGSIAAGLLQFADLRALRVGASLELFGLRDSGAATHVEFPEPVEVRRVTARGQTRCDVFEVASEMCEVVHNESIGGTTQ